MGSVGWMLGDDLGAQDKVMVSLIIIVGGFDMNGGLSNAKHLGLPFAQSVGARPRQHCAAWGR